MLPERLNEYTYILASKSKRRQELFSSLGLSYVLADDYACDESYPDSLAGAQIPVYISEAKSVAYTKALLDKQILITADTLVMCGDKVLGKPADRNDAIQMLQLLSGKKHEVYTAVTLRSADKIKTFIGSTDVYFRALQLSEIEYYIDNFKPYDKAGAYGIQEWIGYVGVERIEGSYYNVVGLPIQRFYVELLAFTS